MHVFVSYSSFTEDYLLHGAELAPCPQQLPAPVLLAHGSSRGAWVLTPRSILLLSPARGELPLPFAGGAGGGRRAVRVCASRGDVAVLAVEKGEVKVLCRYTTEYDVGCVEVKASAEGCVVLLGEWVTNCLHVLTVAAGVWCASSRRRCRAPSCLSSSPTCLPIRIPTVVRRLVRRRVLWW